MNCVFCENEIKTGAEIIDAKTIKDNDVLIRKMVAGKNKIYAHALCFVIAKKKNISLLQYAKARDQSDNNDVFINQKLSGFVI